MNEWDRYFITQDFRRARLRHRVRRACTIAVLILSIATAIIGTVRVVRRQEAAQLLMAH